MEFLADITYAISKKVAKENKDSMIGTIAIMFMALATILSFISIFCKGED